MPDWYQWHGKNIILALHVRPGAAQDRLDGCHGDRLKIRISAPPADGRANIRLRRFLTTLFSVPRRQVELLSGQGSRLKRVRIQRPVSLPDGIGPAHGTP
jgi:hypothetical protein